MKGVVVLLVTGLVAYTKALECGVGKISSDNIRQTLSICVKNNETLDKIFEMTLTSAPPTDAAPTTEASSSSSEEHKTQNQTQTKNSQGNNSRIGRVKRARSNIQPSPSPRGTRRPDEESKPTNNNNSTSKSTSNNTGNSTEASSSQQDESSTEAPKESSENCVIQCVLEQLGLTDANGRPEHSKFSEGLLKNASGREIRSFLQESADECFQQVDEENDVDSCSYSTKLVTCLADKGRVNCSDWPAGNLPF